MLQTDTTTYFNPHVPSEIWDLYVYGEHEDIFVSEFRDAAEADSFTERYNLVASEFEGY